MHNKLAKALQILDFLEHQLVNEKSEVIEVISFESHVKAFFNLLALADYLNDALIDKAVDYLDADKLFMVA